MDDFIGPDEEEETGEERQLTVLDKMPKGDKMALVKFDGTAITERGNVVSHEWFKGIAIDSNAYSDIMLTPTEARQLRTAHQRMKTGASAAAIMTCFGPSVCPMARNCPYVQLQDELDASGEKRRVVPLNRPCPIEQDILTAALGRLVDEYEIGGTRRDYTDQRIVLELAELEVMEHRINAKLASDPELQGFTEEKLISTVINKEGSQQDNYVKDIADLVKIKEKLWNRKDKLRKELVGTRREQRLISAREGDVQADASTHMAEISKRFKQMMALQEEAKKDASR
jgi:hypothetical protein